MMKKRDVVKSNTLFNDIINNGVRLKNKYYMVCYLEKDYPKNNYGIAVGKKVSHADIRNKINRQVRDIIHRNYIIICKKEILDLDFRERAKELISLLNKGEKDEK